MLSKNRPDKRFYKIWTDLKQRCTNPNCKKFNLYGGRGIMYDYNWKNYDGFKKDMWDSYREHVSQYGEKQTTLDRIDVNDHYTKENCRWATYSEQRINQRNKEEYVGFNLITKEWYNFNNCSEFSKNNCFRRQKIVAVMYGKQQTHKNCIFARVTTNIEDAKTEIMNKAIKYALQIQTSMV